MDAWIKPFWYVILISFLSIAMIDGYSQEYDSTGIYLLDDVTVYGLKPLEFASGSIQQRFDSALKDNSSFSITELLQKSSTIYIKEYGNQMLSTLSVRGTGAGHTSTLWNGISISSPTLGQFDYSQAPSIIVDELILHHGGTSSLFGNESIGGSVILNSHSQWAGKPRLLFVQEAGSFGSINSRLKFTANNDRVETSSRIYFSSTHNNFPYTNILKPGKPIELQTNARSRQHGFVQDLYWRPRSGQQASLHAWYHSSTRELQPSMANPDSEDSQEDQNLRIQATWQHSGKAGYLNTRMGFIHDFMLYNNTIATSSDQLLFQTDVGSDLGDRFAINIGGSYAHIIVDTDNYARKIKENRWDIYSWLKYIPNDHLTISANLRSSSATGFVSPVSPSIGSELILRRNYQSKLSLKSTAGYNYRIPTLNDRYWNPGGNPSLKPERSLNLESSLSFKKSLSSSSYDLSLGLYNISIDDWIIWLPQGSIWKPENLRKVRSSGIEWNAKGEYLLNDYKIVWKSSYTYTKSTNLSQLDQYDRSLGKQLPYVPYHNLLFTVGWRKSQLKTEISTSYTSKRFTTTDNTNGLEGFWLTDFMIGNSFHSVDMNFRILNVLDKAYFHIPYRSMPGRNYRLSISLKI